jgi:hypothetical protein
VQRKIRTLVLLLITAAITAAMDVLYFRGPVLVMLAFVGGFFVGILLLIKKELWLTGLLLLGLVITLMLEIPISKLVNNEVESSARDIAKIFNQKCATKKCEEKSKKFKRFNYLIVYIPPYEDKKPVIIFDQYSYRRKSMTLNGFIDREWQND